VNATGTILGSPSLQSTIGNLTPGSSVNIALEFNNPGNVSTSYTPVTYSGI
jgi:hypothetical protein